MQQLDYSRKMDTTGRLVIPIRLREELNMQIGKEYQFFKHIENGKVYLCVECSEYLNDIEKAKELLKKEGYEISK